MEMIDGVYLIGKTDISYLEELLIAEDQTLNVLPYSELKDIPQSDISQFCVQHGYYLIPTVELVDFIKTEIGPNRAIEIGSGSGTLCRALGIIGTDNYMQAWADIKAIYGSAHQTPVSYGAHVQRIAARDAIRKYRPDVVVAAWVTHLYNPKEYWRRGNMYGVEEEKLINKVLKYIHIGNDKTHGKKPALKLPHAAIYKEWIVSRAMNPEANVMYVWEG